MDIFDQLDAPVAPVATAPGTPIPQYTVDEAAQRMASEQSGADIFDQIAPNPTPAEDPNNIARALEGTATAKQAMGLLLQPLGENWQAEKPVSTEGGYISPRAALSPEWARNATEAAKETLSGFIPKTAGEAARFVEPAISGVEDIGKTSAMIRDMIQGKSYQDAYKENFPESQVIPEAEKTPPYSKERFQAGFGTVASAIMLALGGRGLTKPQPQLETEAIRAKLGQSETRLPVQDEFPSETPAVKNQVGIAPKIEGEPSASKKSKAAGMGILSEGGEVGTSTQLRQQRETLQAQTSGADVPGETQEAQGQVEPIGITETLAELNRRGGRAPELPTPQNKIEMSFSDIFGSEEPRTTGIAQRVHDARFKAGQQGEVLPGVGTGPAQLVEQGRAALEAGADPQAIISRVNAGQAVNAEEMGVLRARHEQLSKATDAADQMRRQIPTPEAKQAYETAFQAETNFAKAIKPAATQTSEVFRALQGETDIDTGTFTGLRRAVNDLHGRDVKTNEEPILDRAATQVQKAHSEATQALQRASTEVERNVRPKGSKARSMEELRDHLANRIRELTPC